jgi:alpha-glucosidase (family GH31 glycosyl hydrolase)
MTKSRNGYTGTLVKTDNSTDQYGADVRYLTLLVVFETADTVRVKIIESGVDRWEIPTTIIPREDSSEYPVNMNYKFSYTESPFSFSLYRVSDNALLFDMSPAFVFKNQYIELSTSMPSTFSVFGLGESARLNQALTRDTTYTLWAADTPSVVKNVNLYGSYPFYLQVSNGKASGAVFMNR